ncbi:hypothetical protein ASE87_15240 [Frigoribacterium sp. Leaf44]|nr:hypothetical protein ASE87_15240 [Frigoribacterium sp. Leaf44]
MLDKTTLDLLVLVGDVYQIEFIEFGDWFLTIRSYFTPDQVFELTKPYRTRGHMLMVLLNRVRALDDRIDESMSGREYARPLDACLFTGTDRDDVVLCLNCDGLYGIINIDGFSQTSNPATAVVRGNSTLNVGDPVPSNF